MLYAYSNSNKYGYENFFEMNKLGKEYYNFLNSSRRSSNTIIFHIQNDKVDVNSKKFSLLLLWRLTITQSKALTDILKWRNDKLVTFLYMESII